ncbi:hypothetical protein P7K49_033092 [Saguinus oedipus]|uniref:Uncharacterized protein n=1 Tax=Saguinus oedipus TaxID=9490 RepID=A0ABQ9TQY0_SAGOE|nr:hypothetical protein P7K49_033092 [Saguinus oedipus]
MPTCTSLSHLGIPRCLPGRAASPRALTLAGKPVPQPPPRLPALASVSGLPDLPPGPLRPISFSFRLLRQAPPRLHPGSRSPRPSPASLPVGGFLPNFPSQLTPGDSGATCAGRQLQTAMQIPLKTTTATSRARAARRTHAWGRRRPAQPEPSSGIAATSAGAGGAGRARSAAGQGGGRKRQPPPRAPERLRASTCLGTRLPLSGDVRADRGEELERFDQGKFPPTAATLQLLDGWGKGPR